ncbi:nuclease-like protein [Clostridium sp. CAG:798]|nr:nuclease-like protein [Clostridium sp. CAG:798]
MKKIKNVIMIIVILISICDVSLAHGGNITGWKDKNSKNITEYNGKYYGYHKEDGVIHYHQVKWDEEKQKWTIILPAIYYDKNFNRIEKNHEESSNKIEVELVGTVDGDTAKFKMNGEQITVRFLGINTKETVDPEIGEEAWGKEASDFTKEKLENATKIELEFDSSTDEKDKYNRYLAWIWVDDELLQNSLVESGLAENYMLKNNYKYAGILQESEENAKNNKLGIWSDETNNIQNNENNTIEGNKTDIEDNNLLYMIISITIVLIISIFNITHNTKKRK